MYRNPPHRAMHQDQRQSSLPYTPLSERVLPDVRGEEGYTSTRARAIDELRASGHVDRSDYPPIRPPAYPPTRPHTHSNPHTHSSSHPTTHPQCIDGTSVLMIIKPSPRSCFCCCYIGHGSPAGGGHARRTSAHPRVIKELKER